MRVRVGKKELKLALLAALMLFLCLLGASGAARADNSYQLKEDTSKWAGTLTNVTSNPVFKPKFSFGDTIYVGGIPFPSIKFGIEISMGIKADFDLDIRQGTLVGLTEDSWVSETTPGLSHEKISDNLFDYLPSFFGLGFKLESFLRVGASAPIKLKGTMENTGTLTLSNEDGLKTEQVNTVEFTSVRPDPRTEDEKVVYYVGTDFKESLNVGYINILDIIGVGPLLRGEMGFSGGALGVATLAKNDIDLDNINEMTEEIHTCTENGKEGCVSGSWRTMDSIIANVGIHVGFKLFGADIVLYSQTWPVDSGQNKSDPVPFVQSLTWGEPLKKERFCEHIVYKVPARLWYNHAKTKPVTNWPSRVSPTIPVRVDPNVRHLTSVKPDENGKLKLFLPYMDGSRYTLTSTWGDLTAKGTQPYGMGRGGNPVVDLFVASTRQQHYSVKKVWDIDIEDKDRPENIQVLLQRSSYYDVEGTFDLIKTLPGRAWENVQIVTLKPENDWSAEFDPVPAFEVDGYGDKRDIRYRVRELRQAERAQDPEDLDRASSRIVLGRWDLENTHIWEKLKGRLTNWQTYWQIEPTEAGLSAFLGQYAIEALYPQPTVTLKVPEYTNVAGERVEEHDTWYWVDYHKETEEDKDGHLRNIKMTITNTAALSINIYKRWVYLGDEEPPDHVYIALLSRPKEAYIDMLPEGMKRIAKMWMPVLKPLYGDNIHLLTLLGLDEFAKFDFLGLLKIPVAVAKVTKPPKDAVNPLIQWRARFQVKKYGYLAVPGIPVEFEGAEVTSVILQNLINVLTGINFPVSFSPAGGFLTVPGKAYQIPGLDKEWEKTSNVINVKIKLPDTKDTPAIAGVKTWTYDKPADRPASITLHIKDGDTAVADLMLKKNGNNLETYMLSGGAQKLIGTTALTENDNVWPWALTQSNLSNGVTLDPNKTYTITEDPVKGYVSKIEGHNIINASTKDVQPAIRLRKLYDGKLRPYPDAVDVTLKLDTGRQFYFSLRQVEGPDGIRPGVYELLIDNLWRKYIDKDKTDFNKISVKEQEEFSRGYNTTYSGPEVIRDDKGLTYVYTITNKAPRAHMMLIQKKWVGDSEEERPDHVNVTIWRDGAKWVTYKLTKAKNWSLSISGNHLYRADGTPYDIRVEEEVPAGYLCSVRKERGTSDTGADCVTYTLTNTKIRKEDMVTLWGIKTWNDNENNGRTRPNSITVHIRNNKYETVKDVVVRADEFGEWIWRVPGLPGKDAEGQPISYYVTEEPVPVNGSGATERNYYVTSYKQPVFDEKARVWRCDIHNTLPANATHITVTKSWDDNDNAHGWRPESVKIRIYQKIGNDPRELLEEVELSAKDNWTYQLWTDKKTGATYSVEEDDVPGYIRTIPPEAGPDDSGTVSLTITNTLRNYMTIQKVWVGDGKYLSKRPSSVKIHVKRETDGHTLDRIIQATDGWKIDLDNTIFPLWDAEGNPIEYTVTEEPLEEYTAVVSGSVRTGFTVTNTLKPRIKITKVWNSGGRPDEPSIRPESVKVRLTCAELGIDQELTITPQGDWELTLDPDQYPVLDGSGREYSYTLTEILEPNSPYTFVVSGSAAEGFTVVNTPKGRISITKRWVDGYGEGRPEEIKVKIRKKDTGDWSSPITLTRAGNWKTYLDPNAYPVRDAGALIEYELQEVNIPNGYTFSYDGDAEKGYIITNARKTVQVTVNKIWLHGANPESQRPKSLVVRLKKYRTYQDGSPSESPAQILDTFTLTQENNWTHTFDNLPVLNDGWVYTADEETRPDHYWMDPVQTSTDTQGNKTVTITNRYSIQRRDVRVKKVWDDGGETVSHDNDEVTVQIKAGQVEASQQTYVLKKNDDWSHTFTNLLIYYDEQHQPIPYRVKETVPTGYTCSVTGDQEQGFTITNTRGTPTITVKKIWNDNDNEGATRPTSVKVYLKRGTDDEHTLTLQAPSGTSASNEWTGTFDNTVPVYDEYGELIDYTLTEDPVPGYSTSITGNARDGFTIVNTLEEHLSITKRWMDGDYANRPKAVKVYLKREDVSGSAPQEIVLEQSKGWTTILNPADYPVSGSYTLTEEPLNGYTYSYVRNSNHFIVTNTRATMNVYVRKVWEHGTNTNHPTSVQVQLKKGNAAVGSPVTLDEAKNWQHTFENLDFLNDGSAYSVEEVSVPPGYTRTITRVGNGKTEPTSFTITNTYVQQTKNIIVRKTWEGDAASVRPDSVTVRIEAEEDSSIFDEATLNEGNEWTHTFTNLPVNYGQSQLPITYTVRELDLLDQYDVSVSEDVYESKTRFTITNTLKNEIHVTKVWNDNDNERGERPESVRVYLKNPGGATLREATLDGSHAWSHTFTGVPLFDGTGQQIAYKVTEEPVPLYKTSVSGSALDGFVVTNSPKERITITKVWNDNDNVEGHRPSSVTVHLKKNGARIADLVLSEFNEWTVTLNPDTYPVYDEHDQMISYTLEEDPVPQYNRQVSGDAQHGFVIVNTLKDRISVTKVWVDENDPGRPETVTFSIKRRGSDTPSGTFQLTRQNNWVTTLDANTYPAYDVSTTPATPIDYELTEETPNGYSSSISGNAQQGFVARNIRNTFDISVYKEWIHGANPEDQRPSEVTIQLKKGDRIIGNATLNAANNWHHTFSNLDALRDGSEYTVDEVNIPRGYTRTIARTGDGKTTFTSFTITNTYVNQTRNVSVRKEWVGDEGFWRPGSVRVRIEAINYPTIYDEATLSVANNWSHTFKNLRYYLDDTQATQITYRVREVPTPTGYTEKVAGDQEHGFVITNTLKTINVRVNKVWDDNNNQQGNRPSSIFVVLRGDGAPAGAERITQDASWTHLFKDLPEYEDNIQISYSLYESEIPGYMDSYTDTYDDTARIRTFTITNKASTETVTLNIEKKWAGEGRWQSEYRPKEVKITIAGGGQAREVTLRASEDWKATVTGLPRYVNGQEVEYFLNEWKVNGYRVSVVSTKGETVDGVTPYSFVLTNTLVTTDIPVVKYWWDEATTHPPVTFVLYSNREAADEDIEIGRLTLTEEDADPSMEGSPWKGRFTNLPVFTADDGRAILYTLKEEPVEGYDPPIILRESQQEDGKAHIYTSFDVVNYPVASAADASVIKLWEDNGNEKGIRPQEVLTRLWHGRDEVAEIRLTGEDPSYGGVENIPMTDERGERLNYTLTEEELECYDSNIQSTVVDMLGRRIYLFVVQNTLREDACVLTYDPNGGTLEGSTEPLKEGHRRGETVSIHRAPVREGYVFLYWKGSEYSPGDDYTVTGDHTFVAQWVREDALDHKFTFTKRWSGTPGESIDWSFYDAEGHVVRKRFNKKVVSDVEWQYAAWFESPREYYLIEKPVPGYETIYRNVGKYAEITDRCYNGGTIINYRAPATGDESRPLLWIALGAAGLLLLIALLIKHRRKR